MFFTILSQQFSIPQELALHIIFQNTHGHTTWKNTTGWNDLINPNYCTYYGIKCDLSQNVIQISLRNNGLIGEIPDVFDNLPFLKVLDFGENLFIGNIPPKICEAKLLQEIYIDQSNLQGYMPDCLCAMQYLTILDISNNQLSGGIVNCDIPSLQIFNAFCNVLAAEIPFRLDSILETDISCNKQLTGCDDRQRYNENLINCFHEQKLCQDFCVNSVEVVHSKCPLYYTAQGCDGTFVLESYLENYLANIQDTTNQNKIIQN